MQLKRQEKHLLKLHLLGLQVHHIEQEKQANYQQSK